MPVPLHKIRELIALLDPAAGQEVRTAIEELAREFQRLTAIEAAARDVIVHHQGPESHAISVLRIALRA